ncbi:phosphatase [Rhodococcoides trifolii]|uniref:Phosphatase n=1 Tax=Rhodococcoides trifolii TaxID=908250 RepID=A0A917LDB8_9NOCA|nr:PHP domain-containing protein [Rhodococcus trifolii]GGG14602.1 phosphatase [Rhodococcus trifolii]
MLIDLHTHSTASDGTESPSELVRTAIAADLSVLAITDHDTTSGWSEAVSELEQSGSSMRLVRGMEMSCTGRGADGDPVPVHLLAYLFDPDHEAFAIERERLRDERRKRLRAMAARFQADGIPLDADAILEAAGPSAGRPHLARELVRLGKVSSVSEAFEYYLKTGGTYYVEKQDTPLDDAVAMVASAGGVPVIAHARARKRGRILAADHIEELAAGGLLGGLEVDHPDHDAKDKDWLRAVAVSHGIAATGSSDYHGTNKTTPIGAFTTDPEQFAFVVARANGVPVIG